MNEEPAGSFFMEKFIIKKEEKNFCRIYLIMDQIERI